MRISGLVLASFLAAVPLAAQQGTHWIGAQIGTQLQLGDTRGANDAVVGFGVTGGMWITPSWGFDAGHYEANIGSSNGLGSGMQKYTTAAVLYDFLPANKIWNVYAKTGFGSVLVYPPWSGSSSTATKSIFILGAGVQYHILFTPTIGVMYGAEIQMQQFNPHYHEWPVVLMVAYTW